MWVTGPGGRLYFDVELEPLPVVPVVVEVVPGVAPVEPVVAAPLPDGSLEEVDPGVDDAPDELLGLDEDEPLEPEP